MRPSTRTMRRVKQKLAAVTVRHRVGAAAGLVVIVIAISALARFDESPINTTSPAPDFSPKTTRSSIIWAVGDGADGSDTARELASMIANDNPDLLIYLGDVYPDGSSGDFADRYEPVYSRLAKRTAPTPGNHDWPDHDRGYDRFWKQIHGRSIPAYYAFDMAGWQLISVNTELEGDAASRQLDWLDTKLANASGDCSLVFMHRPRYSAGKHGDQSDTDELWQAISGRAAIVIAGHDHNMQRLKPIDQTTVFVSGAGGHGLYDAEEDDPRLAFSNDETYGALRLQLTPHRARHAFVAIGGTQLDSGSVRCDPKDLG